MEKTSLERVPFARAGGACPGFRGRTALGRASLLIGTGLLFHTTPAWAVNECGPPPPGGGTVNCPAGEYPNGIDYLATPDDLTVVLQPGVVTRSNSWIETSGDLNILGALNTQITSSVPDFQTAALIALSRGTATIDLDRVSSTIGEGIYMESGGATSVSVNSVTTRNSGIFISQGSVPNIPPGSGTGVVVRAGSVTTTASALGGRAAGIEVGSTGVIRVQVSSISTGGGGFSNGIGVFGPTAIFVDSGSILTRGARSAGIFARGGGPITINSNSVTTTGRDSIGIFADSAGDLTIVSDSITTTGGDGVGIETVSTTGITSITSRQIRTSSDRGHGIEATGGAGDIRIVSNSIATTGVISYGILGMIGSGTFRVSSQTIETSGPSSNGMFIRAFGGSILVDSDRIRTSDNSATGIVALTSGNGNISINARQIATAGFDSFGILASAGTGTVTLTSSGDITTTGASAPGLSAESRGAVVVTAANVSASGSNSDAIAVKGGTSLVTIGGLVQSSQGMAVRGQGGLRQSFGPGGPVTINILASGTVQGRVSLTGNADRIDNSGLFNAIGTSQFGDGTDLFDNAAGAVVRSVNGAATFAGLESFANRGVVDLRDGAVGDSLALPGAYTGAGAARLGLDVDLAAGTADRLITGAATGSTTIDLRVVGGGGTFTAGILLVDAGAGTSPTAFSLAAGGESPYLRRDLRFDAANNDFLLVQGPGQAVFETARFGAMAGQLWYESADAVAAQLDTQRDGRRGRDPALWLQGWTGERERSGVQTFGTDTFDVSFEQDFQGLQGGLDFQAGSAVFGITGGAGRSDAVFAVTGNPVDMEVKNIGLYAQGRAGPLFFNALAKRDWAELEIAPGAGLGAEFDADLFGVQANAGLRLDFGTVFAEPSVGLSWMQADLDSFESGPATVDPGDVDSLRARAGLRAGAKLPLGGGTLLPFAAVDVYEELGDDNETDFTLGETLRLFDEPAGTRGQAAAGLSFVASGFEAFVRGEMDFSGDADAKAVRAGARLRF